MVLFLPSSWNVQAAVLHSMLVYYNYAINSNKNKFVIVIHNKACYAFCNWFQFSQTSVRKNWKWILYSYRGLALAMWCIRCRKKNTWSLSVDVIWAVVTTQTSIITTISWARATWRMNDKLGEKSLQWHVFRFLFEWYAFRWIQNKFRFISVIRTI